MHSKRKKKAGAVFIDLTAAYGHCLATVGPHLQAVAASAGQAHGFV